MLAGVTNQNPLPYYLKSEKSKISVFKVKKMFSHQNISLSEVFVIDFVDRFNIYDKKKDACCLGEKIHVLQPNVPISDLLP